MKVGIIGAGSIGKTIAQRVSEKGHQIVIANSRGPQTVKFANDSTIKAVVLEETLRDVNAVILAIPFGKVRGLPKGLFSELSPEVPVIETTNYQPERDGLIWEIEYGKTHSVWVQEQIGRPVVKAFNSMVAYSLMTKGLPKDTPGRIALPVAGDNQEWKEIAMRLVDVAGFDGFDAGTIAESWRQQPVTPAYCTDLTAEELKPALARADKDKAVATRKISIEMMADFGEDYLYSVITGDFPDYFEEKMVNLYRSLHGIPLR